MNLYAFTVISLALAIGITNISAINPNTDDEQAIIALERAMLDRWCNGDPDGYLELMAPGITYFDPSLENRKDGLEAMKEYFEPVKGKIKIDRDEMKNPKVQIYGDTAVLSYNYYSYIESADGSTMESWWNCTEVYSRINGEWKIVHSHWSHLKPELK